MQTNIVVVEAFFIKAAKNICLGSNSTVELATTNLKDPTHQTYGKNITTGSWMTSKAFYGSKRLLTVCCGAPYFRLDKLNRLFTFFFGCRGKVMLRIGFNVR